MTCDDFQKEVLEADRPVVVCFVPDVLSLGTIQADMVEKYDGISILFERTPMKKLSLCLYAAGVSAPYSPLPTKGVLLQDIADLTVEEPGDG